MAGKLNVSIVTPEGAVTRKEVDMVTAPSALGEVGILPDHIPLMAKLDPGIVTMKSGGAVDVYSVSGGFVEVERENVVILADSAERPEDIDVARCEKAIKEATEKLKGLDGYDPEYLEAQERIRRNEARIRVAGN